MRGLGGGGFAHRLGADHGGVGLFLAGQRIDLDDVGVFQLAGLVLQGQCVGARTVVGQRGGVQGRPGLRRAHRIRCGRATLHESSGGDAADEQRASGDQGSGGGTFHNRLPADHPQRS
ncbi:hypothetical protein D3C71_1579970 [compost metagenome]